MLTDFGYILLFIIAGLVLVGVMLTIAKVLRPSHPNV
jgi:NADH-quinone oxidoreductase subunit A